jgi:hypothetical protein
VQPNYPAILPYSIGMGDPGVFSFATMDVVDGNLLLGYVDPGQNGSTFVAFPFSGSKAHFVSRSPTGSYLVGTGTDTSLTMAGFPALNPGLPLALGTFGCANPKIPADAIAVGDQDYIVAIGADQPNDDCLDGHTPGLANVMELERVNVMGTGFQGAIRPVSEVEDIQLARLGGAFVVGWAEAETTTFSVVRVSDNASFLDQDPYIQKVDDRHGQWALTTDGDTIVAIANIEDPSPIPEEQTELMVSLQTTKNWAGEVQASSVELGVLPADKPTIVLGPDGRSVLVAFVNWASSVPGVTVARADCGLVD